MGQKLDKSEVTAAGTEFLTIKEFIDRYNLNYTPEAIGYHCTNNKVDWMQPVRDRFIVLTSATLNFYSIVEK